MDLFDYLDDILENKIFLTAFVAWLAAQAIKMVINLIKGLKIKALVSNSDDDDEVSLTKDMILDLLWKTGGMPSSHVAMSSALTVAVGFQEGFSSSIFIVTFFFTSIVIRDSTGVRLLAGNLARAVNILIKAHNVRPGVPQITPVPVVEGHTKSEVFVGLLLGIFIGVSVYLL